MANNRMQIYCKICLEATTIAKYYPVVWGAIGDLEEDINDFFEKHNAKCFKEGDKVDDILGGTDMYGFRTECDKDGYLTAFDPYRIFKP